MSDIGHNNPPEPTAIEAARETLSDLELEATNWFDGAEVETQAQADEVSRIIDAGRKAEKTFKADHKVEKQPHLDAGRAVDAAWKPLIEGADRVVTIGKAALTPFLMAQERAKREAEAEARRIADQAAAEARRLAEAATTTFAGAIERDDAIERANAAQAQADAAARQKAGAKGVGVTRTVSLRTSWHAQVNDHRALLNYVARTAPAELSAWLEQWAATAVRTGARTLPGVEIYEQKAAA